MLSAAEKRYPRTGMATRMRPGAEVGLSVRQPWAELILSGRKTIEVRSWRTSHRGALWIHAGRQVDDGACAAHNVDVEGLVLGAIVGSVSVEDCFAFDLGTWTTLRSAHLNIIPFNKPYFGWVLSGPRRVQPIPYRGSLGLMAIEPAVLAYRRSDEA